MLLLLLAQSWRRKIFYQNDPVHPLAQFIEIFFVEDEENVGHLIDDTAGCFTSDGLKKKAVAVRMISATNRKLVPKILPAMSAWSVHRRARSPRPARQASFRFG